MKNLFAILVVAALFFAGNAFAQDSTQAGNKFQKGKRHQMHSLMQNRMNGQHGHGFVDANGDGYNDNAPDDDGDGIPNGMDPDFTGSKMHHGNHGQHGFVDADGDGINDNAMDADGDGIPNGQDPDFVRPQDGNGRMNGKGMNKGHGMHGQGNGSGMMGNGSGSGNGFKGKGQKGHK